MISKGISRSKGNGADRTFMNVASHPTIRAGGIPVGCINILPILKIAFKLLHKLWLLLLDSIQG